MTPVEERIDPPVFVDGIGPPLRLIREDYAWLAKNADGERVRIHPQAAYDMVSLIDAYLVLLTERSAREDRIGHLIGNTERLRDLYTESVGREKVLREALEEILQRQSGEVGARIPIIARAALSATEPALIASNNCLKSEQTGDDRTEPAQRITHGRHCDCSACAAQDWTEPQLASCGMHGSECPGEYQPLGRAGEPVQPQEESLHDSMWRASQEGTR